MEKMKTIIFKYFYLQVFLSSSMSKLITDDIEISSDDCDGENSDEN